MFLAGLKRKPKLRRRDIISIMDDDLRKRVEKLEKHERITGVILGLTVGLLLIPALIKLFG